MPKTQTACPACQQPVLIEIQQVFDISDDSLAKQKLLSNSVNFLHCPSCGYQGMVAVPIVYHDQEKELLLTFFPPDLKTPINEQEKQIGPLINRIIDRLPQEKRKAYLLQPQNMLTYQTLIEKVLEADGITKEMIDDQQKKVRLLERLITTSKENRLSIIKEEEAQIDISFFTILSRIVQSTQAQGDENSKNELLELQQQLFENTKIGKELFQQAKETEGAIKSLQDAGKDGLTREKLLELIINTKSETELSTIVSLAHSGLDYMFFQLLTEKIESAKNGVEKQKLTDLREKLLSITEDINNRLKEEFDNSKKELEKILQAENIEEAVMKNINSINDFFVQILEGELSQARKKGDLDRINKLEQVMVVIEKISSPAEDVKFLESMLEAKDEKELDSNIAKNNEKITEEFLGLLNNVIAQSENQSSQSEMVEKLKTIYRKVLKVSMLSKMEKEVH